MSTPTPTPEIDFDAASVAWHANKIRRGPLLYYRCAASNRSTGKPCGRAADTAALDRDPTVSHLCKQHSRQHLSTKSHPPAPSPVTLPLPAPSAAAPAQTAAAPSTSSQSPQPTVSATSTAIQTAAPPAPRRILRSETRAATHVPSSPAPRRRSPRYAAAAADQG
jgi:hypothetical protein